MSILDGSHEQIYIDQGYNYVCGADECGTGALAGPVVAAAVILKDFDLPIHIHGDSKKFTEANREKIFDALTSHCLAFSYSFIGVDTINIINILNASQKAMAEAAGHLHVRPDMLLVDGGRSCKFWDGDQTPIIKGDENVISIAAASIIAKVVRDRYMRFLHSFYPEYNWRKNKGYGTKEHLKHIYQCGVTQQHRGSFAPFQKLSHSGWYKEYDGIVRSSLPSWMESK